MGCEGFAAGPWKWPARMRSSSLARAVTEHMRTCPICVNGRQAYCLYKWSCAHTYRLLVQTIPSPPPAGLQSWKCWGTHVLNGLWLCVCVCVYMHIHTLCVYTQTYTCIHSYIHTFESGHQDFIFLIYASVFIENSDNKDYLLGGNIYPLLLTSILLMV